MRAPRHQSDEHPPPPPRRASLACACSLAYPNLVLSWGVWRDSTLRRDEKSVLQQAPGWREVIPVPEKAIVTEKAVGSQACGSSGRGYEVCGVLSSPSQRKSESSKRPFDYKG